LTTLSVSWNGNTSDAPIAFECFLDEIIGCVKGQVTNEQSIGGRALNISEAIRSVLLVLARFASARLAIIDVDVATIEQRLVFGLLCSNGF
jgi:hypothetical protein